MPTWSRRPDRVGLEAVAMGDAVVAAPGPYAVYLASFFRARLAHAGTREQPVPAGFGLGGLP